MSLIYIGLEMTQIEYVYVLEMLIHYEWHIYAYTLDKQEALDWMDADPNNRSIEERELGL